MPQLESTSNGKVRIVRFTVDRIVDELKMRSLGDELLGVLNTRAENNILLDFQGVQFLSSSALGVLIRFYKWCKQVKVKLKLCSIGPDILEVFKITNLHKVFDIYKTQREAVAAFGR